MNLPLFSFSARFSFGLGPLSLPPAARPGTWMYFHEGTWMEYDKDSQSRLTVASKFGARYVVLNVNVKDWGDVQLRFIVDLHTKMQYRESSGVYEPCRPNMSSPARRVCQAIDDFEGCSAPSIELKDEAIPKNWILSRPGGTKKVDAESDEYKSIAKRFETCGRSIITIFRIEHYDRWQKYLEKKKATPSMKEQHLFHGSDVFALNNIVAGMSGLSMSHIRRGVFGMGLYFAKNSATSVMYSPADPSGERHMLLCRVLIDKMALGNQSMTRPPDGYDATCNAQKDIIVKYNEEEKYEEYVISFR